MKYLCRAMLQISNYFQATTPLGIIYFNFMLLKSTNGSICAWSNLKQQSYLLVSASNEEASSTLYYNQFDLAQKDTSTQIIGTSQCQSQISCLAWDNFNIQSYQMGLVAAGTVDGYVYLYDAQAAIQGNDSLVSVTDRLYEGPVSALEFNEFKPSLLALGGHDVLIMDLVKDVSNPDVYNPGDTNLHEDSTITSISWNRKVQHILASASQNGLTVVWDLKTNKSIFNFQDSSAVCNRKVSLAWNPEIPTQIAVTYDDERVPELQIWDLRNPQGPVVVFSQAHKQGINSLSWCPSDQSLILTGGRDGQVICWNYKTQSIVSQEQCDFVISDLRWSKKVKSLYSISSASNFTQIQSLSGSKEGYAPKWYKPPVGSCFNAFDNFATFRENSQNISIGQIINRDESQIYEKFGDFCLAETAQEQIQIQLAANSEYHEYWQLLNAIQRQDKKELITTLGFHPHEITQQTENYTGKRHTKKDENPKRAPQQAPQRATYDFATISDQDAESFFDQLTTKSLKKEQPQKKQEVADKSQVYQYDQVSKNVNWDAGVEKIIKDNLIIGNYEGAIDCALKCGRSAEALLLAYSQSKETFEQTMNTFLTSQTDFFLKTVLKHIVLKQPEEIAKQYELNNWRECAAMVLSNDNLPKFRIIMKQLGDRFISERKDEQSALGCYLLALDGGSCIKILTKAQKSIQQQIETLKLLFVLSHLIDHNMDFQVQLDAYIVKFALQAIGEGQYLAATHALNHATTSTAQANQLFDLLYYGNHSQRDEIQRLFERIPFPFQSEQVKMGVQKPKAPIANVPGIRPHDPVSKPTKPDQPTNVKPGPFENNSQVTPPPSQNQYRTAPPPKLPSQQQKPAPQQTSQPQSQQQQQQQQQAQKAVASPFSNAEPKLEKVGTNPTPQRTHNPPPPPANFHNPSVPSQQYQQQQPFQQNQPFQQQNQQFQQQVPSNTQQTVQQNTPTAQQPTSKAAVPPPPVRAQQSTSRPAPPPPPQQKNK